MKRHLSKVISVVLIITALGCASSPRTVTYKTIGALQTAVELAHKGYHAWAVRYEQANPQSAQLLMLDGRVRNALDVYKSTAVVTLTTLTTNDVPTERLLDAANSLFAAIKGTNTLARP